ncbi:hypothetical protein C6P46_004689 [Rhodotorula mucilaginosa]|uniref:BTB domain-containing protein n=1 Tax=Rhodotorula mucilaginosa TaxID=5537 RepID=A0A9P7B5Q9_RHOMI|nr:hypothetical protein C6P46_004689 [Rhodotorula mucilaginosa]
MLKRKTLEIDWVVEETTTLVKKARLRQGHASEPCEGWKLSAETQEEKTHVGIFLTPVDLKKEIRVSFELKHKLYITCKITSGEDETPAPPADYMKIFNKQEYSDTALVPAEGKYTIFAHSIRIPPSSPPALGDRFFGDVNEFAAFGVQKAPCRDEKPEQDVAATQGDNAADERAAHRNSVSPSGSSGGEDLVPLRKFRLVKVPHCSYATLAAYLAYLYSSKLNFLPSPAFLLAEEKQSGSSTESDVSRWADGKAKWHVYPTLPHAMYRLADCYMEPTLKARAKGWILQNITVETAPFELFSQLSLDYPEIQADVVDFVLANLDDVTATPGWKRAVALIDEGKIPGGGSILDKLLSKARKGTD